MATMIRTKHPLVFLLRFRQGVRVGLEPGSPVFPRCRCAGCVVFLVAAERTAFPTSPVKREVNWNIR